MGAPPTGFVGPLSGHGRKNGKAGSSAVVPESPLTWLDGATDLDGPFVSNRFARSRTEPLPGARLASCGRL